MNLKSVIDTVLKTCHFSIKQDDMNQYFAAHKIKINEKEKIKSEKKRHKESLIVLPKNRDFLNLDVKETDHTRKKKEKETNRPLNAQERDVFLENMIDYWKRLPTYPGNLSCLNEILSFLHSLRTTHFPLNQIINYLKNPSFVKDLAAFGKVRCASGSINNSYILLFDPYQRSIDEVLKGTLKEQEKENQEKEEVLKLESKEQRKTNAEKINKELEQIFEEIQPDTILKCKMCGMGIQTGNNQTRSSDEGSATTYKCIQCLKKKTVN